MYDSDNEECDESNLHTGLDAVENPGSILPFNFGLCDDITKYQTFAKIGHGTFGEVFMGKDLKCSSDNIIYVAMKKILRTNEMEGLPIAIMKEVQILRVLNHENVVKFIEVCKSRGNFHTNYKPTFFLIFEFCEHDLAGLLSNVDVKFTLGQIKNTMQQILTGLDYVHSCRIMHRDLKAANVLINKAGKVKLADFGLARPFCAPKGDKPNSYTTQVITLWFRPPELLLGDRNYGPPIDMWGVGCIMAEMWTRIPIMRGNTEQHQLLLISQLCGSIIPETWPGVESLDLYNKLELPKGMKRDVKNYLTTYVEDSFACDLIDNLLVLDPSKRLDSASALKHMFFSAEPMPSDLSPILAKHTSSMFEYFIPEHRQTHAQSLVYYQEEEGPSGSGAKPGPSMQLD